MGMSDAEVFDAMASALQERGLATPDQIAADRAVQFNTAAEPTTQPKATNASATPGTLLDPQSVTQPTQFAIDPVMEQISEAAFAAPSSPAGYKFDPVPAGVQHDPEQEMVMRSVFHDAGIPNGIAAHVDRMFSRAIQNPPSAAQIEQATQAAYAQLSREYGTHAGKVIEVARREFRAMAAKQPRLIDIVERSGLGSDPYIIASLYRNAQAKGRA